MALGALLAARASSWALATLALDQAHKWWMLDVYGIAARGRVAVTPFLDLVYVKNIGISYSLLDQDSYAGQLMLAGFGVAGDAARCGSGWRAAAPTG